LSEEELRAYTNATKKIMAMELSGGQTKVMSSKRFGVETMEVNNFDLDRLDPDRRGDKWLNDEIINFYLALVAERQNAGGKIRVLAHSTYFWTNLIRPQYNYQKVSRWSKRRGAAGSKILDLDYMIIPINQNNMHWTLAVINFKKKRFEYYDSLGGNPDTRKLYTKYMANFIQDETGGKADLRDWQNYQMDKSPRQANGSDCGLFVIKTAEMIVRGVTPSLPPEKTALLRRRVLAQIVIGKL